MTTSTPDSHFTSLASLSLHHHHHHYPYRMESRNTREHHHQMEPPWSYSCGFTAAGFAWPPRSHTCSFCKREFRSAQALGGHMNVHRRDRARLRHCSPPPLTTPNPNPNSRSPIPNLNFSPPHCPHPVITHTFPSLLAPLAAPPQAAAKAGLLEVNLELAVGVRSSGGLEDGQLDLELRLGCF